MSSKPPFGQVRGQLSPWIAWRNAFAVTLLGCALFGLLCFVVLGGELTRRLGWYRGAIWLEVSFAIAGLVAFAYIIVWQRRRGSSLAELGWGRPTTPLALVLAVILGAAYTSFACFGAPPPARRRRHAVYLDTALARSAGHLPGRIGRNLDARPVHDRVTARSSAGLAPDPRLGRMLALYHAFQNPTLIGFLPSFILFSLHAGLYVLGRRSLTPVILAHSIYHVLGEPYLLMMVFAATPH